MRNIPLIFIRCISRCKRAIGRHRDLWCVCKTVNNFRKRSPIAERIAQHHLDRFIRRLMSRLYYPFGTLCRTANSWRPLLPPPTVQNRRVVCKHADRYYLVTLALVRQPSQPLKNGGAAHEKGAIKGRGGREREGRGHEGIIRVMTDLEERPQKQTREDTHGVSCLALHSLRRPRRRHHRPRRRRRNGLLGEMLETTRRSILIETCRCYYARVNRNAPWHYRDASGAPDLITTGLTRDRRTVKREVPGFSHFFREGSQFE